MYIAEDDERAITILHFNVKNSISRCISTEGTVDGDTRSVINTSWALSGHSLIEVSISLKRSVIFANGRTTGKNLSPVYIASKG